jgi:serine/threonine-protein kinase
MVSDLTNFPEREQRLNEAVAAYLEAVDAGQPLDPAAWLARFPDLAADLLRFFADQQQVNGLLASLRPPPSADGDAGSVMSCPGSSGSTEEPAVDGATLPYFGDYQLLAEIARGGMGVVYRARQVSLNRVVALKRILAGRLAAAEEVRRFRCEAEVAANLDHPNVVPIYEVGEYDGQHFFTMKLIEGGNLAQHAHRFRGDPRAAARLLTTIARAVHHAHQRGLLHRDLKPANVLLDEQGLPHLTDFGLARRLQAQTGLTRPGIAVGTPSYMAPEQAAGPGPAITTAADVYSLGAILYELLSGRPPFHAEHPLETLRQLLEREPQRLRTLDPRVDLDLETVCLKCLEKDPGRRYASAAELADDLERFLRGEPVHARRAVWLERLWRWCRRRPLTAALVAALALCLATGAGLITWQWRRAEDSSFRAEVERVRAEEGFRQAQQAVNDFYTRVSEGRMRDAPGLQRERREVLETALAYYERFLRERGEDPALRAELADLHLRIGTITSLVGPKSKALEAYLRALAVYDDLLRTDPGSVSLRQSWAETRGRIGIFEAETGRTEAALTSFREAGRQYEELLRERPSDPALENGAAIVFNNLGSRHRLAGRVDEAADYLRRARDLHEDVVRQDPTAPEFRANLAVSCCNLAALEAALGRRTDAHRLYQRARDLQEQLVEGDPVSFRFQQELAATCRQLGGEQCLDEEYEEALRTLERGQSLLERLARAEPGMASLKCDLAAGCRQTGHAYRGNGQLEAALAQYDKGVALMEDLTREYPEVTDFRNDLAKCHFDRAGLLHRTGRQEEALRAQRSAADLRRELVAAQPENLLYRRDLGLTLVNLGMTLRKLGRDTEALATLREGVQQHRCAFTQAPQLASSRSFLSGADALLTKTALDMGYLDEAVAAALERQKLWPGNPTELYAVAVDLARAADVYSLDSTEASEKTAGLALGTLREAVAAGFQDARLLRREPAFASLRGRPDFADIVTGLEAGKKP